MGASRKVARILTSSFLVALTICNAISPLFAEVMPIYDNGTIDAGPWVESSKARKAHANSTGVDLDADFCGAGDNAHWDSHIRYDLSTCAGIDLSFEMKKARS